MPGPPAEGMTPVQGHRPGMLVGGCGFPPQQASEGSQVPVGVSLFLCFLALLVSLVHLHSLALVRQEVPP